MRPAGVGLGANYAAMADLDRSQGRRRSPSPPQNCSLGQGRAVGGVVECGCSGGRLSLFLWSLCWRSQMISRQALWRSGCALVFAGTLLGALYAQRPFREYPSVEYGESVPLPRDWHRPAEWTFARLMYPRALWTVTAADSMATGGRGSRFGRRIIREPIGRLPKRSGVLLGSMPGR